MEAELPSKYEFKRNIGEGVFGVVMLVQNKQNAECVAVKKLFAPFHTKIDAQRTYREIAYLKLLEAHPNIIQLKSVERTSCEPNVFLVFELMSMDLQTVVTKKCLNDEQKRYVMYQLFRALNYMHAINVTHRDLKPSNILLSTNCELKVADFGLAKVASHLKIPNGYVVNKANDDLVPMTEYIATRWYRAPELLVAAPTYTTGIDVWSAGCIMGEVLLNRPLFPGMNATHQLDCIMSALPAPSAAEIDAMCSGHIASALHRSANRPKRSLRQLLGASSEDSILLLESILVFQPQKRLTAKQCMQHVYIEKYFKPEHLGERPPRSAIEDNEEMTVADYKQAVLKMMNDENVISNGMNGLKINKEAASENGSADTKPSSAKKPAQSSGLWW